ncbi:MAG: repeat-containing protein [Betaproteobacteria bacterium]|nr:repeat-containing protein [Betaproteobacteria bacterium]
MKRVSVACLLLLIAATAAAQPANPPDLGYVPAPEFFQLPAGMNFGGVSGVAINSKGNIFVLHRGAQPLVEFDSGGRFIRALGAGLLERPHGLRIDADDNIWIADGGAHIVLKLNPQGRIIMVLGSKGTAGEWHEAGFLRNFSEPNDIAFSPRGEIYVTQGHGRGDSRVLKFDRDGRFIKTWGGKGEAPGQFNVPHSIAVDSHGLVYVADRGNNRVQVFDADGGFIREWVLFGTPAGLYIGAEPFVYLANGHHGQIIKLDMNGAISA